MLHPNEWDVDYCQHSTQRATTEVVSRIVAVPKVFEDNICVDVRRSVKVKLPPVRRKLKILSLKVNYCLEVLPTIVQHRVSQNRTNTPIEATL